MRPGLHLSNCSPITPADEDIVKRWAPLSALLAMNNIVEDEAEIGKLVRLWEIGGRPLLVLRKYFQPEDGTKPNRWGVHAMESVIMARRCMVRGIPAGKIALKPFNEPNMPTWACNEPYGEGFGDKLEHIERYGKALATFIDVAKNEEPDVLIGGPHLTVGNRDVRFPNDPEGRYYYGPNSLCQYALDRLDLHFVHCYGFRRGQYADRAHGLRFLEYEKYFSGKPIYIVEGCYGIQWENGNSIDPAHNNVRGEDTVAYLRLLDQYPQVQGITFWIGGWTGWQEHRHSDDAGPGSHRPVVFYVEQYVKGELPAPPPPEPPPDPGPGPTPEVMMRAYLKDGSETDPGKLLEAYSVVIAPCQGPGFYVVEVRERCEPANCDIWVKGQSGELMPSQAVRWGWPGTEVSQNTGPDGRVGFAMANTAKYDPAQGGGPHWAAVSGNSETVRGIGMVMGTVHCTLNYVFQYADAAPEPPPGPPPGPEPGPGPGPGPEVPYELLEAVGRDPYPLHDLREEVKAISKLALIPKRTFGQINGIVVHHTGSNGPQTPMGIAKMHIDERGWPTIGYHFVIGWEGERYFTAPLVWEVNDCGYLNPEVIGVAVMGDFVSKLPSNQQLDSLRLLIYRLEEFLGQGWGQYRGLYKLPHSYLGYVNEQGQLWHTACPGKLKEALVWSGAWPGRSL